MKEREQRERHQKAKRNNRGKRGKGRKPRKLHNHTERREWPKTDQEVREVTVKWTPTVEESRHISIAMQAQVGTYDKHLLNKLRLVGYCGS